MKKLFVLFIVSSLNTSLFTACLNAQRNEPFTTYTFSALAMSPVNVLEATVTNGSITMTGSSNSEAVVEMYVSGNSPAIRSRKWSDEEIKQELERTYNIEVKVDGEKILIVAKQKSNSRNSQFGVYLKITAPAQINSNFQTTNGSIQISDLSGSHVLQSTNGSLKVENTSGNISGRTTNGSITVTNSNDGIDLRTTNGSVTARNCNGEIILTTTNGGITAKDIKGELKLNSNGGMKLEGISGNLEAKISRVRNTGSDNGSDMIVTMESVGDYVKLSTDRDNVNLTLPVSKGYDLDVKANNIKTSGLNYFSGSKEKRSLNGKVSNGGTKIEISTSEQANIVFN